MGGKPKILYLAGWGRSGSTLIARALGGIDGWCTVGEARLAWANGVLGNQPCGCSAPFHDCPFWSAVFAEAFGGMDRDLAARMAPWGDRVQTWHMNALPAGMLRRFAGERLAGYVDSLDRLYRAIAEVAGARVIVDSSKMPSYGYALSLMPGHDVRIGHLVRDPRACSYSWARRRKKQPLGRMRQVGPLRSSLQWVNRNRALERALGGSPAAYRVLRYEDFIADPKGFAREAALFMDEDPGSLSHIEDNAVRIAPAHLAAGNPNRFESGRIAIRLDVEWRDKLPRRDQALVALVSHARMRQYGYA
jgi:hypothetical protein